VNDYRWINHSQPQTLQTGTMLLYVEGVLGVLLGSYGGLFVCVAMVVGGFGVANDKRWGYGIALAAAVLNVLFIFRFWGVAQAFTNVDPLLSLMFGAALVGLLLHPMSRSYQRIWFK
jgi:hypothetical protein